jgi:hypothetical protein
MVRAKTFHTLTMRFAHILLFPLVLLPLAASSLFGRNKNKNKSDTSPALAPVSTPTPDPSGPARALPSPPLNREAKLFGGPFSASVTSIQGGSFVVTECVKQLAKKPLFNPADSASPIRETLLKAIGFLERNRENADLGEYDLPTVNAVLWTYLTSLNPRIQFDDSNLERVAPRFLATGAKGLPAVLKTLFLDLQRNEESAVALVVHYLNDVKAKTGAASAALAPLLINALFTPSQLQKYDAFIKTATAYLIDAPDSVFSYTSKKEYRVLTTPPPKETATPAPTVAAN